MKKICGRETNNSFDLQYLRHFIDFGHSVRESVCDITLISSDNLCELDSSVLIQPDAFGRTIFGHFRGFDGSMPNCIEI